MQDTEDKKALMFYSRKDGTATVFQLKLKLKKLTTSIKMIIGKGEPKYLNSKETAIFKKSHELFGLDKAKDAIAATGVAVVMEGYTDVILSHESGFRNAVATLGTALTINHIRILAKHAKKRIVYLFDGDEAGQKAIARALQFIDYSMTPEAGRMQVDLCAVTLPDGLDPADYISSFGVEEFRARVD